MLSLPFPVFFLCLQCVYCELIRAYLGRIAIQRQYPGIEVLNLSFEGLVIPYWNNELGLFFLESLNFRLLEGDLRWQLGYFALVLIDPCLVLIGSWLVLVDSCFVGCYFSCLSWSRIVTSFSNWSHLVVESLYLWTLDGNLVRKQSNSSLVVYNLAFVCFYPLWVVLYRVLQFLHFAYVSICRLEPDFSQLLF